MLLFQIYRNKSSDIKLKNGEKRKQNRKQVYSREN